MEIAPAENAYQDPGRRNLCMWCSTGFANQNRVPLWGHCVRDPCANENDLTRAACVDVLLRGDAVPSAMRRYLTGPVEGHD